MRKILAVLVLLCGFVGAACAQVSYVAVTATVTDPSGNPYANAQYSLTLVNAQGLAVSGAKTPNGQIFNGKSIQGALDSTGHLSIQVVPNSILNGGVGTFWKFSISAPSTSTILTVQPAWIVNYQTSITGSVDLSTQLSALTQPINFVNLATGQTTLSAGTAVTAQHALNLPGDFSAQSASSPAAGTFTSIAAPRVDLQTGVLVQEMANNTASGATLNQLLCAGAISNAPVAQTCTITSSGWTGIVTGGATGATAGNTQFARGGNAQCVFDGQTVFGDYVQISSTVAGDCHDSGLTTYPVSGAVVGRVRGVNSGAGTMALVDVYSPGIVSNNAPLNAGFSNQGLALTAATACGPQPQGLPRSGTISSVSITGSVLGGTGGTGSVTVDVLTETLANFRAGTAPTSITNGHPLVLTSSGGNTFTSGSFSLWSTTALTQTNVVCFAISSVSTFTGVTIQVTY